MVNRDSLTYKVGRGISRIILIELGYILEKRYCKRPIDKVFPEKK